MSTSIISILQQFTVLSTPEQVVKRFGSNQLDLEHLIQLIHVVNPEITNHDIETFYQQVLNQYGGNGINVQIYEKIIQQEIKQSAPKYQSTQLLQHILKGVKDRDIEIDRVFRFFDKNGDKELQEPEFRALLEFYYVQITDNQFKILRTEFPNQPLTLITIQDLFKTWQEIIFAQGGNQVIIDKSTSKLNPDYQVKLDAAVEDDRFQNFINLDFNIPGAQQLKDLYDEYLKKEQVFIDEDFPSNSASLGSEFKDYQWIRLHEYYSGQQRVFLPNDDDLENSNLNRWISPQDIVQGQSGDCYFMATLSTIAAKQPELIQSLFPIQRANKYGVYGVKLCINGEWQVITLDDYVPVNQNNKLVFTQNKDNEIWVALLEKAWAKVYKSYTNIQGGDPREVMRAITGGPVWLLTTEKDKFTENFKICLSQNTIMVTGTHNNDQKNYKNTGLVPEHAYSVLDFVTLQTEQGQVDLIKLRNPWAQQEWNGDWSDNSQLWTPQLKQQIGVKQEEDGIFYMSVNDFTEYFHSVCCCYYKPNYEYTAIKCQAKRNKGLYYKFEIKSEGEYFITVHQESKRQHHRLNQYDYSYARMLLSQILDENKEHIYIESKNQKEMQTYVGQVGQNLKPGNYIVFIKIKWHISKWAQHQFILSTYGNQPLKLIEIPKEPIFLNQSMLSLIKLDNEYQEVLPGIIQKFKLINSLGIGYIFYKNTTDHQINFETNLVHHGGCKLTKPERGYLFKSYLQGQGERIVTFTVIPPITQLSIPTLGHKLL